MKKVMGVFVVLLLVIFYICFLQYRNVGKIELTGYIVTNENIIRNIKNDDSKKQVELTNVKQNEFIYRQNDKYYVGEKEKKEILLNYPVISTDDSKILSIDDNVKLINSEYKLEDSFKNMIVASKNIYNTVNYEQVDNEDYYFLLLSDNVYVNNVEIEIINNKIIPKYSIVYFAENKIKYYYKDNNTLKLDVVEGISNNSILKIENDIEYYELLKKLNLVKEEIEDNNKNEEEIIIPDNNKNEYETPIVKLENIKANTYSMKGDLIITDKNSYIKKNPTIELIYKNEIYLKKTFYQSDEIELTGLLPDTEFKLIGSYTYINEKGVQIKKTFIETIIKTKDMSNLDKLDIAYKITDIYPNKAVLNNIKLLNDSNNEVLKGIKKAVIKIGTNEYNLNQRLVSSLKKLEAFNYETINNLKSNTEYNGEINIYDVAGNKLKIKNNKFTIKTSKQKPEVKINVIDTDITRFKLGVEVINEDDVNIENFRYEIYDINGVLKDKGLINNNTIESKNLSANEIYKVKIYGDFDLLDGFGNRIDYLFKEINISTQSISLLGFIRLNFKEKEITNNKAIYEVYIDENATDSRLIELLDKFEVYLNDTKKLNFKDENIVEFDNLDSNTEYNVSIKTIVKQGDVEYTIDTISNLEKFKTLKKDAEVFTINEFTNSNMIDFDVYIKDLDNAILSNRIILEVRNNVNKLVLMKDIKINSDYERITIEKLDKNMEYTFMFIAEEYNIGHTNLTYEASKVIKEIKFITNEGISGKLELSSLLSQITSNNIFDVSNKSKWVKIGSSTLDDLTINNSTIKMSAMNGSALYKYYLPEYNNKKIKVRFLARYASDSNNQTSYFWYNNKKINLDLTSEYKEYTYEFTLNNFYLFGFQIDEIANNNTKTLIEVKDLYITEINNYKDKYENYKEKDKYLGKFYISLQDIKKEIKNNKYYIKVIKNNKEEKLYDYSLNNEFNINRVLNEYELDKNVTYKFILLIKIRDRYYELDSIEVVTDDEIRSIKTPDDFFSIHQNANYIVINDLDLTISDKYVDTYAGTIDFQGHSVYQSGNTYNRMFQTLLSSAIVKNLDLHAYFNVTASWKTPLVHYNYGIVSNLIYTVEDEVDDYISYNSMIHMNYGTIENFVVYLKDDFYAQDYTSLLSLYNYGFIKNGYLYSGDKKFYAKIFTGAIVGYSGSSSHMDNVFSLIDVVQENDSGTTGNISGTIFSGIFNNVYTYSENTNINTSRDINFGSISYISTKNVFYVNPNIYQTSKSSKLSKVALRNETFQDKLLNTNKAFNVSDFVPYGYYPQVIMNDVMPKQEYISLPEVKNEDLVDILSTEEVKEYGNYAIVKLLVHNPSSETIKRVGIKDLTVEILDQTTERGLTTLSLKLTNPLKYISSYFIKEIETVGVFNISYTRKYDDYEKVLNVNMYKSIENINDWKNIKNNITWNYRLESDLDFNNVDNSAVIGNFSGLLDGNNHKIENITVSSACGVICTLRGSIKNLNINSFTITHKKFNNNNGFIAGIYQGSVIDNVHFNDVTLTLGPHNNGALAGYINPSSIVTNSSVNKMKIINNENSTNANIGGLIGYSSSSTISNCYVADIDFLVNNVSSINGLGGIVGFADSTGIYNSYALGVINTNYSNVGGIVGLANSNTKIDKVISAVDIYSTSNYIGGIAGNISSKTISNSLSIGNLYTSVDTNYLGRIIGNNIYLNTNNYAFNKQHINGTISDSKNGEILLSKENLSEKETYQNIIKLGNDFSYDNIDLKLPKLYYKETTTLLPNQKDIEFNDTKFEIIDCVINQSLEESYVMFKIENKNNLNITSVEIEDMEISNIRKNVTENGITVLEILINPKKYYDSYKLSKINYQEKNSNKTYIINYKLNIKFYKDIESFEDWQSIDKKTAQNYRLIADIDFKDKVNINTNVILNRLEGINDGYTLKNVNINSNQNNIFFIKEVKTSLKNINFENFNIESTGSGNGFGIIGITNGSIENINFNNNKIIAKNINYVGSISNNTASSTKNINLNNIEVVGGDYVGGLIAKTTNEALNDITLKNMTIKGKNYTGGLIGYKTYNETNLHFEIDAYNVNVNCIDGTRCGGVYGYGEASNVNAGRMTITGISYVGGISGQASNHLYYNKLYDNSIISGSDYVGGLVGNSPWIYHSTVKDVKVTGHNYIGGLSGYSSTKAYNSIVNVTVEGNDYVGGATGRYDGVLISSEIVNTSVKGHDYVGGVYGAKFNNSGKAEMYYNTINITVLANGSYVGGIIGYYDNSKISGESGVFKLFSNIIQNANIIGKDYVGGLIGKIEKEFGNEANYINNNVIIANVTSEESNNSGIIIGNSDLNAVNLKNIKIYNKSKLNNKLVTEDTVLAENNFVTRTDLLNEAFYKRHGLGSSSFDLTHLKEGYYPYFKNLSKTLVKIPDNEIILRTMARIRSFKLPDVNIYPVDINKINIDFSLINDYLYLEINNKEYPLTEKTMTFYYDFKSDINFKIKDGINEIEYTYKSSDLRKMLLTYDNNYAYLKNNNLFVNKKQIKGNYIHLYNKKALTNDNYIYDLISLEKYENNIESLSKSKEVVCLDEYTYNGMNIKVFNTYTLVDKKIINKQIFYKNGKFSMISSTLNNYKDSLIIDSYNNKDYLLVLSKKNEILNLKNEIKYPASFKNNNIIEMSSNYNNSSGIILVRYLDGSIYGFDYRIGIELVNDLEYIDVINYVKNNFKSLSKETFTKKYTNAYGNIITFKEKIQDKVSDSIESYDSLKEEYEIYDIGYLTGNKNDLIIDNDLSINDNIYKNYQLNKKYENSLKIETPSKINLNIIYGIIIIIILFLINLLLGHFIKEKE